MKKVTPASVFAVFLLALAGVSACAPLIENRSTPLNFYVLTPAAADAGLAAAGGGPFYVVAPPRLPDYLQQSWLVTRIGANELALAESDRWASPLADNTAAVLAENLSRLLGSDQVILQPVPAGVPIDYEIRLDLVRFERQPDGRVALVGRWSVFRQGGTSLALRSVNLQATEPAGTPSEIAASMSALLAELAADIAGTLRTLPQSTNRPQS